MIKEQDSNCLIKYYMSSLVRDAIDFVYMYKR